MLVRTREKKSGFRLKLGAVITSVALILTVSGPANASLSSDLNNMFSNVTAPGGISSATRMGWAGGGVGVRGPVRNIQIIAIDPPRLSAGCGGIDLYGGSFSFINSEQLVALFRAIAANAIGVAFKAAIKAINPMLADLMTDFQQILQALNALSSNTCSIASSIVQKSASYLGINEITKSSVAGEATATGSTSDTIANFITGTVSSVKNWFNDAAEMTDKAAKDPKFPEVGNLVWKALAKSGVANEIGNPITGETSRKASKEFLMSMLGTYIVGSDKQGKTTGQDRYDNNDAPPTTSQHGATISLRTLRDGMQDEQNQKLLIMRCSETDGASGSQIEDGACNIVTKVAGPADFNGIQGYVNKLLFGIERGKSVGYTEDSIIGKLRLCNEAAIAGCSFTQQQNQLLYSFDKPLMEYLKMVQHNPIAMANVADAMAPILVNKIIIKYGHLLQQTAEQAFDGKNQQPMPDFIRDKLQEINQFIADARKVDVESWDKVEQIASFAERIRKNTENNLTTAP